jgi:bifunctional oligoribonuclease and PAP phosphatase NrnA
MTGSDITISDLAKGLSRRLPNGAKVALTAHVRPDGDAIGSTVGLFHLLQTQGYAARILDLGSFPKRYAFLESNIDHIAADSARPQDFDVLIVLDTGSIDRAPAFVENWRDQIPILNIDHHPTNTSFGSDNYILPAASAVAEIITRLALELKWSISPEAATALWVGIVTDTGRFAYSCTTPDTLCAAAALVRAGIDTPAIDQRVFQDATLGALQLQARAVKRMQLLQNERIAVITLSRQDYKECRATSEDAEEIINIPRRLDSVDVAILLTEMEQSTPVLPRTKASFRTRPPFDAGAFCLARGGGGHARAAGCELACSLESAAQNIVHEVLGAWFPS